MFLCVAEKRNAHLKEQSESHEYGMWLLTAKVLLCRDLATTPHINQDMVFFPLKIVETIGPNS
jgi:hypothetical protein